MWQWAGRGTGGHRNDGNGMWRRLAAWAALAGAMLLTGCASTVVTDVTAFRQPGWQNEAPRTYSFERTREQAAQLERQTYEQWLADALATVGFEQVPEKQARYRISMEYNAAPGMVRVAETVYPDPWYGPWGPYWGPYGFYRPWGPWGWPGYWPPQTVVRDVPVTLASLRVYFKDAASGQRVYQVSAQNQTEDGNPAAMMPYLIRSAFTEFPGESGRPRRVTLPVDKGTAPAAPAEAKPAAK